MAHRDAFAGLHPVVSFVYFAAVLGFSMVFMHPICLLVSLIGAVGYYIHLHGRNAVQFLFRYALPVLLLTAAINPAFNHQGTVILAYFPSGNPLTLESLLYGAASAVMLVTALLWFACYAAVTPSDKIAYLFGRAAPSLALLFSMTLRFVPAFHAQFERVKEAQAGMGRAVSSGGVLQRTRRALACFSAVVTWALEHAADTADSMKSRGYGLRGRTAFSIYVFTSRDKIVLLWMAFCILGLIGCAAAGQMEWRYFPYLSGKLADRTTVFFQTVYFIFCMLPLLIDRTEEREWKLSQLKI